VFAGVQVSVPVTVSLLVSVFDEVVEGKRWLEPEFSPVLSAKAQQPSSAWVGGKGIRERPVMPLHTDTIIRDEHQFGQAGMRMGDRGSKRFHYLLNAPLRYRVVPRLNREPNGLRHSVTHIQTRHENINLVRPSCRANMPSFNTALMCAYCRYDNIYEVALLSSDDIIQVVTPSNDVLP
jgi:hypothetical protein